MFKIRAVFIRITLFTRSCARVCNKLSWSHHDFLLKLLYQDKKVSGHVYMRKGYRFCLIL